MGAVATITWLDQKTGYSINGGTRPARTAVWLTSRHHAAAPSQYVVHERLPKSFWRFGRTKREERLREDAVPADTPAKLGGVFYSERPWDLPEPDNPSGVAIFEAQTDLGDGRLALIKSSAMEIEAMTETRRGHAGLSLTPSLEIGAKASGGGETTRVWKARVPTDPWIEVSVVQGSSVLEHLRQLATTYTSHDTLESLPDLMAFLEDPPPSTTTYFVDRVADDVSATCRLDAGEDLRIRLNIPPRADLRASVCLRVTNLDSGAVVVTDPVFVTTVGEAVITTDMTLDMLRRDVRTYLETFQDTRHNLEEFSYRIGMTTGDAWQTLVDAADELGADSVADAARFAALGEPILA